MTLENSAGHAVSNSDKPQRVAMLSDALWSVKFRLGLFGALFMYKRSNWSLIWRRPTRSPET